MTRKNQIESNLCRIGRILGLGSEKVKITLKNRKTFIMIAGIIIAALAARNLSSVCLKYLPPGPQDFAIFNRFPFSLLF